MIIITIYLTIINILSLFFCGIDKFCARRRMRRIPERVLLGFCAAGGAAAFWAGMQIFRHKTKHFRFAVGVPVMAIVWALITAGLYYLLGT